MRKFIILLCCLLFVTSCDFVRRSLGKPTSEDINRIRLEKAVIEAARADSLARIEAAAEFQRDSIQKAKDSIAANQLKKYYIIVGSFTISKNADNLAEKLKESGFDVRLINPIQGMTTVAICGNDNKDDIIAKYIELKDRPDFKYEAYVYDVNKKLVVK